MNKPEYTFSDLVHIAGYGSRIFKIESFFVEHWHTPDKEWTDIIYNLVDTETGHYIETEEDTLRLADGESTEGAGDELDVMFGSADTFGFTFQLNMEEEETKMAKEPRKPTARELSGQEAERRKQARKDRAAKVDALLDEMNDTKVLVEMFPEDDEFKAKVEYLTVKLAEVSAEEAK